MKIHFIVVSGMLVLSLPAHAESINYQNLEQEGFGDVAELLKSMTPQQRDAIFRDAKAKEADLAQLPPAERAALEKQLRKIAATIDMPAIDPNKIDVSKGKKTGTIQKELGSYQKKYQQGKIHNAVVKPPPPPE